MRKLILTIFCVSFFGDINGEQLRVLSSYVLSGGISLQCPLTGSPNQSNTLLPIGELIWLNEANQNDKQDADVVITNEIFLNKGNLVYDLKQELEYISCGYFGSNGKYVRIKKWKINYVKEPQIQLIFKLDESIFSLRQINETLFDLQVKISQESYSPSGRLFQLGCKNNFDVPISTSLIWINLQRLNQSKLVLNERWNRFFNNNTESEQVFYNADSKRTQEFGYFIKLISNDDSYRMNLQCVSYVFGNTIIKESNDFYVLRSNESSSGSKLSKTALILIIVFSIIAFILIVAIVLFLFFCLRRTKFSSKPKTTVIISSEDPVDQAEKVFRSSIRIKPSAIESPTQKANAALIRSSASDLYSNNLLIKKDPFSKLDEIIREENYTQLKIVSAESGEFYERWTNAATMTPESSFHIHQI